MPSHLAEFRRLAIAGSAPSFLRVVQARLSLRAISHSHITKEVASEKGWEPPSRPANDARSFSPPSSCSNAEWRNFVCSPQERSSRPELKIATECQEIPTLTSNLQLSLSGMRASPRCTPPGALQTLHCRNGAHRASCQRGYASRVLFPSLRRAACHKTRRSRKGELRGAPPRDPRDSEPPRGRAGCQLE